MTNVAISVFAQDTKISVRLGGIDIAVRKLGSKPVIGLLNHGSWNEV
jgi:hypothetical protein